MEADSELRTAIQRLREQKILLGEKIAQLDSAISALCELIGEPIDDTVSTGDWTPRCKSVPPTNQDATPRFSHRGLFGLSQRQAATDVLRLCDRPMTMIAIL